ncbi:MAG: bifunctional (p)ppGpp synthetase/guanosine-3',5'-bis(diphosphate) 3'-pyrophosphohydrolase [Nannocystaceae bacterium]
MVTARESTFETVKDLVRGNFTGSDQFLDTTRDLIGDRDPVALRDALPAAAHLAELRLDPPAVAAALLVQAVTDGAVELATIEAELGEEVAALVDGVRKLGLMRWDRFDAGTVERLRQMFLAIAADVRVVLVALALRLRDMRELREQDPEERRRIARETLEIYAPLANRLGIFSLKWELEDLCLRELEPEIYKQISKGLAATRDGRKRLIDEAITIIGGRLNEAGIAGKISGRPKHIYSIYKKMQRKRVGLDEIYDASAVRVLVERLADCYAVLGLVHSLWTPIAGEFDDYIAKPKGNGYQSLHTAVIGPGGKALEIQIRTHEMHYLGEYGIAAHWRYKENTTRSNRAADEKFNWLRQVMEWQKEVTDPRDLVESLKTDIFQDQAYVFTPTGDVIDLPVGATPVDFAYRVHTQVGHRCRGALVNGTIVPLDYKLQTGDRVEILTHKKPQPSRDWLSPQSGYVHSPSTRQKIRQWFRQQGRGAAIVQGRELLERELRRVGLDKWKPEEIAELFELRSADDMLASIGFGDTPSQTYAMKILDLEREQARQKRAVEEEAAILAAEPQKRATKRQQAAAGVSIAGVGDILSQPARCCTPVPGDPVIGYISRGRGVVIHRRDCPNIVSSPEPERLIELDWGQERGRTYPVTIAVHGVDRPGLMRDVLDVISDYGVNLSHASASSNKREGIATVTVVLEIQNNDQVLRVLNRIERIDGVTRAHRKTD